MDDKRFEEFLLHWSWPSMWSSSVWIHETDDHTAIDMQPIPLGFVHVFLPIFAIICYVVIWTMIPEQAMLPSVLIPFCLGGFYIFVRVLNKAQEAQGPMVAVADGLLVLQDGTQFLASDLDALWDCYVKTRFRGSISYRRIVLADHKGQLLPVAWQMTGRSRWVRPKPNNIAELMQTPIEQFTYQSTWERES